MFSAWLCWLALALLLAAVGLGLGVMLFPRGRMARDLGRDLTDEVEAWHHPETHRQPQEAGVGNGPNA